MFGGGGGGGGGSQNVDPGMGMSILSPLLKIAGMGISARGGMLGPAMATAGDIIDNTYRQRRQQAASDTIAQLLPIARSEEIKKAVPGQPDLSGGEPAHTGTPDVPAVTREWMGERRLPEALEWLKSRPDIPASVRAIVEDRLLSAKLPTDVERPQAVQEEVTQAKTIQDEARARQARIDEEARRGPIIQGGAPPGVSPGYGASAAAGVIPPSPPPSTRIEYKDGKEIEVDARTGLPLKEKPIRTPEQEEQHKAAQQLFPQWEATFEQAVKAGTYTAGEAQDGRRWLAEAKRLNKPELFLAWSNSVAQRRAEKERAEIQHRPKPDKPPTMTRKSRAIQINDQNRATHQASVDEITADLTARGKLKKDPLPYVTTASGQKIPKAVVIEEEYARRHPGYRAQVTWNPKTNQFEVFRLTETFEEERGLPVEAQQ